MSAGMRVRDGAGTVFWDTNMFMGRTLGVANIGTAMGTGTITDARFSTGIPFGFPVMSGDGVDILLNPYYVDGGLWLTAPNISISGNVLTWTRTATIPAGWTIPSCQIVYGVR